MSRTIHICTDWRPTGAIRLRPGWRFMVAEQELIRDTGVTTGPGHAKWTGIEMCWRRMRRRAAGPMLIRERGEE